MTRRIAISILMTVWLVLILAGGLAYFVTRSVLVADLDAALVARVASLPEVERPSSLPSVAADSGDRYLVQNQLGRMLRPGETPAATNSTSVPAPKIVEARFSTLADGSRIRTITVLAFARRANRAAPLEPVTVVYSGSAERLDSLLQRLMLSLGLFGLMAGLATAWVALTVARAALSPLRSTADVIAQIGEYNLDRRIALAKLPPELVPVGQRLNELLARLETAFSQRKQFLADASHELRTPVAALLTTLEVAHKKDRTADQYARAIESCLEDVRLLHQLVAALMNQVRSERFSPDAADLAPMCISEVLEHCAAMTRVLADAKTIELAVNIPHNIVAIADELKIRSVAMNFLSNAAEYTPPGGKIILSLEVSERGGAGINGKTRLPIPEGVHGQLRWITITVADTGPGIAPEHLPHVFEPFYRADKARTDSAQHLGLGLFLCQSHMRGLGGTCQVDSDPGHGARFAAMWPAIVIPSDSVFDPISQLAGEGKAHV